MRQPTLEFHFESVDACGNLTTADYTVTVLDETAPVFLDVCGIENGGTIDVCAEDYNGDSLLHPLSRATCPPRTTAEATWPSTWPPRWWAPTPPTTVWTSTARGDSGSFASDETCNGYDTHSVRLFNFLGDEFYSTIGDGLVSQLPNGDWVIEKTVVSNDDPNSSWYLLHPDRRHGLRHLVRPGFPDQLQAGLREHPRRP